MRNGFLLFISLALGVYSAFNLYILWRTWVMLDGAGFWRWLVPVVFFLCALAFPISRAVESHHAAPWCTVGIWIGAFWIAAMLYFFLFYFALHFVDIAAWSTSRPGNWSDVWFRSRPLVCGLAIVGVGALLAYGHWNALRPRIVQLDWTWPKLPPNTAPIRIVAVSDIHMGTLIAHDRVAQIVDAINAQKPDLILLVGDTFDGRVAPVTDRNTGAPLAKLKATYGAYVITGNHEFYGEPQASMDYLEALGIHPLRDQAALIADAFYLVGREDFSLYQYNGQRRAELPDILRPLDRTKPVFIMDHQPKNRSIAEAAALGVDAQISGHTHAGQFWPFNYIVATQFKLVHGYKKIGSLNAYVSCGVGTWGPPVRIGNHPEIVVITVRPPA